MMGQHTRRAYSHREHVPWRFDDAEGFVRDSEGEAVAWVSADEDGLLFSLSLDLCRLLSVAVELFEDECTPDELDAYGWLHEARDAIAAAKGTAQEG